MDRLSDYDFDLPEELIAQSPLEDRAASRLLYLPRAGGPAESRAFRDVIDILSPGDLLITNNTRVTALRLFGQKPTGAEVEALLLREQETGVFSALLRPGKRLKPGARILFPDGLAATVRRELEEPVKEIEFDPDPELHEKLRRHGKVPLPPYIHLGLDDPERYQTVYAEIGGSAAAPTAGLHFTPEILAALQAKGIETASVTLDVSLDTFRPVTSENLDEHRMHGEYCTLPEETAAKINAATGRIVAVGTTTVRTVESFATGPREVAAGTKNTSIFIRPGYEFLVIDGMFTNFHLPKTTMLMMIGALAGRDRILAAYAQAIQHRYRFLSFGDSMLIL